MPPAYPLSSNRCRAELAGKTKTSDRHISALTLWIQLSLSAKWLSHSYFALASLGVLNRLKHETAEVSCSQWGTRLVAWFEFSASQANVFGMYME